MQAIKKGMNTMTITEEKLSKALVVQHNALTSASYKMTLNAKRIVMCFISQLREKKANTDMVLSVGEFNKTFNTELNAREMKAAVDDLFERAIHITREYTDPTGKVWEDGARFRLIDAAMYSGGEIQVCFSPKIMPMLEGLKDNFTKYTLKSSAKLKSIYAIRFYELFKQYETIGTRNLTIEEMRKMFDLQDKYKAASDFRKRIIETPIKEINEETTLSVKYEQVKRGRKIIGYRFTFKEDEQAKYIAAGKRIDALLEKRKTVVVGGFGFTAMKKINNEVFALGRYSQEKLFDLLKANNFKFVVEKQ